MLFRSQADGIGVLVRRLEQASAAGDRSAVLALADPAISRPSFEDFMASRRRAYVDNHEIYLEGGALAVDFLGRYEDLDADLAKALRLIGVARRLDVPKSNVTPDKETRQDYRSYYTPETEALVRDWYAPEIELLKYGF